MAITIYGIKNCNTMKKARAWLEDHGVEYRFHDYKVAGIERGRLQQWSDSLGWEVLLNRAGTTFRKLGEADKADLNERKAIALMLSQPSLIKRPVLDVGDRLVERADRDQRRDGAEGLLAQQLGLARTAVAVTASRQKELFRNPSLDRTLSTHRMFVHAASRWRSSHGSLAP